MKKRTVKRMWKLMAVATMTSVLTTNLLWASATGPIGPGGTPIGMLSMTTILTILRVVLGVTA